MSKLYKLLLIILTISGHAASELPGKYYEDVKFKIAGYEIDHGPWFLEAAVRESKIVVQTKEGEDEAARNLACAALSCKILEGETLIYDATYPFIAPYRKYRSLSAAIEERVFISSESAEFLKRFEGLTCPPGDPLQPYYTDWEVFDRARTDEMNKGKKGADNFNASLKITFKLPAETMTGRRERFDDTEQQIVRILEKEYPIILQGWLEEYVKGRAARIETHREDHSTSRPVSVTISFLLHTKLDPCPYCLNRMEQYFKSSCASATSQCFKNKESTLADLGITLEGVYLLPMVFSRMEYKTHPRTVFPWRKTIDINSFKIFATDIPKADDIELPSEYGLILGIIPYRAVWEKIAERESGAGAGAVVAAGAGSAAR